MKYDIPTVLHYVDGGQAAVKRVTRFFLPEQYMTFARLTKNIIRGGSPEGMDMWYEEADVIDINPTDPRVENRFFVESKLNIPGSEWECVEYLKFNEIERQPVTGHRSLGEAFSYLNSVVIDDERDHKQMMLYRIRQHIYFAIEEVSSVRHITWTNEPR